MLEEADIKKLSDVFATKTDLERFATKDEHNELKEITMRIAGYVAKHDGQLDRLEENILHTRETVDKMAIGIDKMVGKVSDLEMEYVAIKMQQNRHEEQLVKLEK